jgi:hypothetical protein
VSRSLLAKLLLGLVGLVLIGGLAVRAADPANQPPAGHQHGDDQQAAPTGDVSWPLLAAPTGVAATFALATGVFWVVSRRRRNRTTGRHAASRRPRDPAVQRSDAPRLARTPGPADPGVQRPRAPSLAKTPGAADHEPAGE